MEVVYVTHPVFLRHETGAWHPERPARLEAVERGVETSGIRVRRVSPPEADLELLALVHDPRYVEAIRRFCAAGGGALDPDTVAGPASWEAALRAAASGPAAIAELEAGDDATAFLAVRPPGHHALSNRAMGFCLFNNAAIAAKFLIERGARVAIVDWDVHHGNGTEAMLADEEQAMYVSLHQHPFYPFDGHEHQPGAVEGRATILNAPLPAGTGGDVYRHLFRHLIVPELTRFSPDWVLVSAGYDAHADDPLAELRLVTSDYGFMASSLLEVVPPNRIVVFLEGGYDLGAITRSVAATVRGLAGLDPEEGSETHASPPGSWTAAEEIIRSLSRRRGGS